jgi:hypothetical protein
MARRLISGNATSAAALIRKAINAAENDVVMVHGPQFERPLDAIIPTKPPNSRPEWDALRHMTVSELTACGCRLWENDSNLMLFPFEWYNAIPIGFQVVTILNEHYTFDKNDITHNDKRFGCLSFGVIATPENN